MKKTLMLLLVAILAFGLVACSSGTDQTVEEALKIEGSLEEIMASIYQGTEAQLPAFQNTPVTNENMAYFLGLEDLNFVEALGSEPMMSSFAHSIVLVRVGEDMSEDDIASAKEAIRTSVDGRKWICVGVEEDQILVDHVGDLIILVMDQEDGQVFIDSFKALAK